MLFRSVPMGNNWATPTAPLCALGAVADRIVEVGAAEVGADEVGTLEVGAGLDLVPVYLHARDATHTDTAAYSAHLRGTGRFSGLWRRRPL